jgi:signal transduction histidine kinase
MEASWGLKVEMRTQLFTGPVSPQEAQQIYYIIHEALTNAARHSAGSRVRIGLTNDERAARIVITDDGHGFPFKGRYDSEDLARLGVGPATMRGRIAALRGTLILDTSETGTTLDITIPIEYREI